MSICSRRVVTPLKRLGGKTNMARWIIAHLPEHDSYIEVFGGAAPVLLGKPRPAGQEVLNDLDGLWCNSYRMIRDQGKELAQLIAETPYSRAEFENARDSLREWQQGRLPIEPLELARRHVVVMRQSFSGDAGSWSTTQYGGEHRPRLWANLGKAIERAMARLQGVYLEQRDYRYILDRYDHPRATFYLDPPYYGVESLYYDANRKDGFDHAALRAHVEKLQGSVAISYYAHPDIEALYGGWDIQRREVTVHAGESKRKETELIIVRLSSGAMRRARRQIQQFFDDEGNDLFGATKG
jgi:DNA adenine methylase